MDKSKCPKCSAPYHSGGKVFVKFRCGSYYDKPDSTLIRSDECWQANLTAKDALIRERVRIIIALPADTPEIWEAADELITRPYVKAIMEEK